MIQKRNHLANDLVNKFLRDCCVSNRL